MPAHYAYVFTKSYIKQKIVKYITFCSRTHYLPNYVSNVSELLDVFLEREDICYNDWPTMSLDLHSIDHV